MKPKFAFYEIVRIKTVKDISSDKASLVGQEGTILGIAPPDEDGGGYAVSLHSSGECWYFKEAELESTGKEDNKANFYNGAHITVVVDPITGEGRLKSQE